MMTTTENDECLSIDEMCEKVTGHTMTFWYDSIDFDKSYISKFLLKIGGLKQDNVLVPVNERLVGDSIKDTFLLNLDIEKVESIITNLFNSKFAGVKNDLL